MSSRTQTLNFTTASTASGADVDTNSTGLPDHIDIVYISVTQSGTAGPFDFKIFKKDGYAAADLLAYWANVQPSLYYPIDNDTGSEAEEGFPIPYDDEDASGETHIRITNKDTTAHTYTVTVRYIEAPQMQSTGRPIFRAGLSLKDSDVAHGVTDVTETTSFFHVDIDSGTDGGARVWGFSDTVGQRPMTLHGVFGNTNPTDTIPAIALVGSKRSGTGRADLGSAETVLKVINNATDLLTMLGDGATQMVRLGLGAAADSTALSKLSTSSNTIFGFEIFENSNTGTSAGMAIQQTFYTTAPAAVTGSWISNIKSGAWTSTASTQDSETAIYAFKDGVALPYIRVHGDTDEVYIRTNNVAVWKWTGDGHYLACTDNSFDIGATGATRPRDLFLAGSLKEGTIATTAAGPHAIGGVVDATYQLKTLGAFTPDTHGAAVSVATALTPSAGNDVGGMVIESAITEAGSGVHGLFYGLQIAIGITNGAATLTNLAGIDVQSLTAPTGTTTASGIRVAAPTAATNNWAINVTSGNVVIPATGKLYLDGVSAGTVGNTYISESAADTMSFITGGTERMQIASNGNFFLFDLENIGVAGTAYICQNTGEEIVTDSATCLVSARKFKDGIGDLDMGLTTVLKMTPRSFVWKSPIDLNQQGPQFGFIADEALNVDRRLVTFDRDGDVRSFRYDSYVAVLTNAIQEQQALIGVLSSRLDSLNERIAS